jgi:AraC-like DNA-binding protein
VRAADSVDDYLRDPHGRYLIGDGFLHWYSTEDLCGFIAWKRPDEIFIRRLVQVLDVECNPGAPHRSLVDLRRLESPDPSAFGLFVNYMRTREQDFAASVQRQALVRPEGIIGAVVGGFYSLLSPRYPSRVFTDSNEAMAWLGLQEAKSIALQAELNQLVVEATGQSPLLLQLHGVLRPRLVEASLSETARELGMSERTLQRRLKEAGTSFQTELNAVQVRTAQQLLLETDMKLTAVAVEVGCASLQHFSSLFRKLVGESPSTWRALQRKTPASSEDE